MVPAGHKHPGIHFSHIESGISFDKSEQVLFVHAEIQFEKSIPLGQSLLVIPVSLSVPFFQLHEWVIHGSMSRRLSEHNSAEHFRDRILTPRSQSLEHWPQSDHSETLPGHKVVQYRDLTSFRSVQLVPWQWRLRYCWPPDPHFPMHLVQFDHSVQVMAQIKSLPWQGFRSFGQESVAWQVCQNLFLILMEVENKAFFWNCVSLINCIIFQKISVENYKFPNILFRMSEHKIRTDGYQCGV
jgi:hypothetical protein